MKKALALLFPLTLLLSTASCSLSRKNTVPVEVVTTDTAVTAETEHAETSTQEEAMVQRIPITADKVKLQSRAVMKDDVLWLVQSGSAAEFCISGRNAYVTLAGSSGVDNNKMYRPHYAVYVNDRLICDEVMAETYIKITLWKDEDKTAAVKVMLLSEAQYGGVGVRSVEVESNEVQHLTTFKNAPLTIEFIGDAITCGYGVESDSANETFMTSTENFSKSYAYLAASRLGADYTTCCYSGYGIVSGYSDEGTKNDKELLPDCYGKDSNFKDYGADWDFSEHCDIVVIHLGTNDRDYVAQDPDKNGDEFVEGYKAFLQTVREKRPDAAIICTVGTMGGNEIYKLIERAVAEFGDDKIMTYFLQTLSTGDGMGADGYPSKKTQQNIADVLVKKINDILVETGLIDNYLY
jgi:hypothetical protein